MPSGSSIGAMVRASVSVSSSMMAPISSDTGNWWLKLAPTNKRVICGTISPSQPIIPATETALAVIRVAEAIKSAASR